MIRTQIQLTETQLQALKALAAAEDKSVAELIREGVEIRLRTAAITDREEQKQRALAIIGRFKSGVTDLSAEHDRYLAEAFGDE